MAEFLFRSFALYIYIYIYIYMEAYIVNGQRMLCVGKPSSGHLAQRRASFCIPFFDSSSCASFAGVLGDGRRVA